MGPLTAKEKVPSLLDGAGALLRDLPVGLSEWAVHPSLGNEESQAIDGGWRVRRTDYEFLTSPQARELLQQEGIVVIDYRPLQQVWSQTRGDWSGGVGSNWLSSWTPSGL